MTLDAIRQLLAEASVQQADGVIEEFELSSITEGDLQRQVARKIRDRIDQYISLLEFVIQPDQSLAGMEECGFLGEKEHVAAVRLYRQLMHCLRSFNHADLQGTKEGIARFIAAGIRVWEEHRADLIRFVTLLEQGWERQEPLRTDHGYVG